MKMFLSTAYPYLKGDSGLPSVLPMIGAADAAKEKSRRVHLLCKGLECFREILYTEATASADDRQEKEHPSPKAMATKKIRDPKPQKYASMAGEDLFQSPHAADKTPPSSPGGASSSSCSTLVDPASRKVSPSDSVMSAKAKASPTVVKDFAYSSSNNDDSASGEAQPVRKAENSQDVPEEKVDDLLEEFSSSLGLLDGIANPSDPTVQKDFGDRDGGVQPQDLPGQEVDDSLKPSGSEAATVHGIVNASDPTAQKGFGDDAVVMQFQDLPEQKVDDSPNSSGSEAATVYGVVNASNPTPKQVFAVDDGGVQFQSAPKQKVGNLPEQCGPDLQTLHGVISLMNPTVQTNLGDNDGEMQPQDKPKEKIDNLLEQSGSDAATIHGVVNPSNPAVKEDFGVGDSEMQAESKTKEKIDSLLEQAGSGIEEKIDNLVDQSGSDAATSYRVINASDPTAQKEFAVDDGEMQAKNRPEEKIDNSLEKRIGSEAAALSGIVSSSNPRVQQDVGEYDGEALSHLEGALDSEEVKAPGGELIADEAGPAVSQDNAQPARDVYKDPKTDEKKDQNHTEEENIESSNSPTQERTIDSNIKSPISVFAQEQTMPVMPHIHEDPKEDQDGRGESVDPQQESYADNSKSPSTIEHLVSGSNGDQGTTSSEQPSQQPIAPSVGNGQFHGTCMNHPGVSHGLFEFSEPAGPATLWGILQSNDCNDETEKRVDVDEVAASVAESPGSATLLQSDQHDTVAKEQADVSESSANTSEAPGPRMVTIPFEIHSEGGPYHVGNEKPPVEQPGPPNTPVLDSTANVEEKSGKPEADGKKGPDDASGSQESPEFLQDSSENNNPKSTDSDVAAPQPPHDGISSKTKRACEAEKEGVHASTILEGSCRMPNNSGQKDGHESSEVAASSSSNISAEGCDLLSGGLSVRVVNKLSAIQISSCRNESLPQAEKFDYVPPMLMHQPIELSRTQKRKQERKRAAAAKKAEAAEKQGRLAEEAAILPEGLAHDRPEDDATRGENGRAAPSQ